MASELRSKVKNPVARVDPIEETRKEKVRQRQSSLTKPTFKYCAATYIKNHRATWSNEKHAQQWPNTLEKFVFPYFGDQPVDEINTAMVVQCLSPIWHTKTETASRLQGRIAKILDWAIASGLRDGLNPARWSGHLDKLLPSPKKLTTVRHHPALPYEELGEFFHTLKNQEGIAARALECLILTATRTSELRLAQWDEIDLDQLVWKVPATRTKTKKEHRVPIAAQMADILKKLPVEPGNPYVFIGSKQGRPISSESMSAVLKRMKLSNVTVHGFRSTFRVWAGELTHYPRDLAEMALAHAVENKVEAAYRRGDMFLKRKTMMNAWATFCHTRKANIASVTQLREVA
jgi:integrase